MFLAEQLSCSLEMLLRYIDGFLVNTDNALLWTSAKKYTYYTFVAQIQVGIGLTNEEAVEVYARRVFSPVQYFLKFCW